MMALVGAVPSVLLCFRYWQRYCEAIVATFAGAAAVFYIIFASMKFINMQQYNSTLAYILDSPPQSRDFQSGYAALILLLISYQFHLQ